MRTASALKSAAAVVAIGLYAALSHYCNGVAHSVAAHELGAALALAPPLMLLLGAGRRVLGTVAMGLLLAGAALLMRPLWPYLTAHATRLALANECALYGALTLAFGASLRAGVTPLCTRFADRLHGPLTPEELRYTRSITLAWTLFLAMLTLTVLLLYFLVPLTVWSLFANFATLPLIGLMFLAEYVWRRIALDHRPRAGLLATVRQWRASPR